MDTEILKYVMADTASGATGVLCTIIESHGSSPREAGTSMWVTPETVRGTVGGGVAEHEKRRCYLYHQEKSYGGRRSCLRRFYPSVS